MKPRTPEDRAVAAIMGIHYGQKEAAKMLGVTDRSIRRYVAEASDETTEVSAAVRAIVGSADLSGGYQGVSLGDWIFERVRTLSAIIESKAREADPRTAVGADIIETARQHVLDLLEHAQTRTYIAALFGLHDTPVAYEDESLNTEARAIPAPNGRSRQAP